MTNGVTSLRVDPGEGLGHRVIGVVIIVIAKVDRARRPEGI
jgi:hypothetical protein